MDYTAKKNNNALKCKLVDMIGNVICEFEAEDTTTQGYNFDFVSGLIASSGQTRTIKTEYRFPDDVRTLVSKTVRIADISNRDIDYVVEAVGWWDEVRKGKIYGRPVRHTVITLV